MLVRYQHQLFTSPLLVSIFYSKSAAAGPERIIMAPRKFSLETPAGQQILKDYLNCFSGGYPPIPPYGVKEHFQKHKMYTDLRGPSTFSTQCKLIAPVAHQQMPQDIFDRLLQHIDGKYPNDKRKAGEVK